MTDVQPPQRRHGRGTVVDMVRSLALVGLIVGLLAGYTAWKQPDRQQYRVDVTSTLQAARTKAAFPVLALPENTEGWTANSVFFDGVPQQPGRWRWHIGYTTPSNGYVSIDASDQLDLDALMGPYSGTTVVTPNSETVNGREWQVYAYTGPSEKYPRAMWVARGVEVNPYAIVVTGEGTPDEVRTFVHLLRDK